MSKNQNSQDHRYMNLAFQRANDYLGSTKENPSVGCILVKNGSVISSGSTAFNGRPHAEANALKKKINFNGSTMYITLEPCVHYGKTSPCVNQIIKNKIKKVYYPILDQDLRTRNKAKKILNKKKIKVKIGVLKSEALNFYKSYFLFKSKKALPYLDAKIAISNDFFSINKKKKWITNQESRKKVHIIRSKYDCILSTYKTVNTDNSKLNCRLSGIENLSPSRVIIDMNFKLKESLDIYKTSKNIKTYVIVGKNNFKKEKLLKSKHIKIIKIKDKNKRFLFEDILKKLKKMGFSRILCEAGLSTTSSLLKNKLIHNLYIFTSPNRLKKKGANSYKNLLNKLKFKKKIKININLFGDQLYKLRLK